MQYLTIRIGNFNSKEGWNKETGGLRNAIMEETTKVETTDKISNEELLREVDEQQTLSDATYRWTRKWIGHAIR